MSTIVTLNQTRLDPDRLLTVAGPEETAGAAFRSAWRPSYHLRPAKGWMNDPCAPAWDRLRSRYYLAFQWNPSSTRPEKMCWGQAMSKDLLHWEVDEAPMLEPTDGCDRLGCWTGCYIPHGPRGEKCVVTVAYTACSQEPIRWDLPYPRGAEAVALITSRDGGKTWHRPSSNAFLVGPPAHLDVCGFRDPQVFSLSAFDGAFDTLNTTYGLLSGGLQGGRPCAFLYTIDAANVASWTYRCLLTASYRSTFSSAWRVPLGANWEVASIFSLPSLPSERICMLMGIEGAPRPLWKTMRTPRYPAWLVGSVAREDQDVALKTIAAGLLDHGLFYAAQTFVDAESRQIVIGWILEDDLAQDRWAAQGWAGVMSLPREVRWQRIEGATGTTSHTSLNHVDSLVCRPATEDGSRSVETLYIAPAPQLLALRSRRLKSLRKVASDGAHLPLLLPPLHPRTATSAYELIFEAECCEASEIALRVGHTVKEQSCIIFNKQRDTLEVDRSRSSLLPVGAINLDKEVAPFSLFELPDGKIETLRLRIFIDGSVIEIFANDRLALTTRVYPSLSPALSLSAVATGSAEVSLDVWELRAARSEAFGAKF